ncbi:GvpL/GvpF family gas vesicle protein [Streptomyces sp. NPDC051907]|uniref:GvpL/GvpF family gas vesicle protein n=1 Tax=Streptomyces sp. NPDC051907 TaxID=3155284 RepID=UPI00343272D8
MAERAGTPTGEELSYVYVVGPDDPALRRTAHGLQGIEGRSLRWVSDGGLAALVSSVPADRFSEAGLAAQLEDLDRLESIARAHHAVVDAAFSTTTVLPMRLATVYLNDDRVCALLRQRGSEFATLMDQLAQHVELGVKVYAESSGVPSPEPAPRAPAGGTGRAYLQQRRAQQRGSQDLHRRAADAAAEAAREAASLASGRVVHRPQQGELASRTGVNVANEAYLVPAAAVAQFREVIGAVSRDRPGVRIDITGPWAPYSFATLTTEREA